MAHPGMEPILTHTALNHLVFDLQRSELETNFNEFSLSLSLTHVVLRVRVWSIAGAVESSEVVGIGVQ